ncbi:hypothetical protein QJS10_CPB13g00290 [Acorus calamus]|uniref:Uncharacterized protein n=1 Tax=Acorus calamus TaxID=4465 RepID=A0AAV9DGC8_ACOCL|nr:hypothetical protein QJS10_CPB13g00290 [Acorus calamus]
MNRFPSFEEQQQSEVETGLCSCWGQIRLLFDPWKKMRRQASLRWGLILSKPRQPERGSFRYDPLSYARNFDDGRLDDEEDNINHGFSLRFAAPSARRDEGH